MREDAVERDGDIAELAEEAHLSVEDARRNRGRVRPEVVDLVVHQHAQRPLGLSVERAGTAHGFADRAVDPVLQELLRPVRAHRAECRRL